MINLMNKNTSIMLSCLSCKQFVITITVDLILLLFETNDYSINRQFLTIGYFISKLILNKTHVQRILLLFFSSISFFNLKLK